MTATKGFDAGFFIGALIQGIATFALCRLLANSPPEFSELTDLMALLLLGLQYLAVAVLILAPALVLYMSFWNLLSTAAALKLGKLFLSAAVTGLAILLAGQWSAFSWLFG